MADQIKVNYAPHGYTYAQLGCPTCGNVRLLPLDEGEPPPYCIHHSGEYSWKPMSFDPERPASERWTQMVRVRVFVDA